MPISKSAKKALRQTKKRTEINLRIKSQLKRAIKTLEKTPNRKNLVRATSLVDRAAKRGVIHKAKASRLKSQLAKHLPKKTVSAGKKTRKSSKK